MASTPPAQIRGEAHTPPTPLHGSAYHSSTPSRYNTRSAGRKTPSSVGSSFTQSPKNLRSSRSPHFSDLHSVNITPKRKSRRTQIISPASPPDEPPQPFAQPLPNPSNLFAATIISEGMLPTPAKTPSKKHIPKSAMAGRALFQDPTQVFESPRKQKRQVRHNGYSLESFSENANQQDHVMIHVDSRDHIPEVDENDANPFYDAPASHANSASKNLKRSAPSSSQPVSTSIKRRKLTAKEKRPLDAQVEEALRRDEGMVYVFRGKKVYKRFDDAGDEEEVIDPEELGLLRGYRGASEIVRPLRTLTRKSIKPRRLFVPGTPSPELPESQLPSQTQDEEEIETEIEDLINEKEDEQPEMSPARSTRSRAKEIKSEGASQTKRRSPFDTWRRLKSGASASSASAPTPTSKGRKRTAAEALDA